MENLGSLDSFRVTRLGRFDVPIHELQVMEFVPLEKPAQVVQVRRRTEEDVEVDKESLAPWIFAGHGQPRQIKRFPHEVEPIDADTALSDKRARQPTLIVDFLQGGL